MLPGWIPLLVTGPETVGHAELVARVRSVTAIAEFTVPILEYPGLAVPDLREIIGKQFPGVDAKRIGVAGLDMISVEHWKRVRPALGGDEIVNADALLFELRPHKSEEEVAIFGHAFRITEAAFEALLHACQPGAREYEVAAAGEAVARARGAEGMAIDTVVASGRENSRPIIGRTGTRELEAGDPVAITFAPRYQGYGAPIGRLVHLGEPPADIADAAQVALEAQGRAVAALRAGVTLAEVDSAARTHLRAHGYDSVYGIGHSCGVQEFEPPYFGPDARGELQASFVMSVDIGMFGGPWGGFRLEDGFLVTKRGAEPLTRIQPGMIVLSA